MMNPRFKFVCIVTYGRTGSTLLQGILNSVDGVVVSGENGGFIYHLYNAYKSLEFLKSHTKNIHKRDINILEIKNAVEEIQRVKKRDAPTYPFYGTSFVNLYKEQRNIIQLVKNYYYKSSAARGTKLLGFKEIRYGMPDLHKYLDFLQECFGPTGFIFLTRNHDEVVKSGFYKNKDKDETLRSIESMEKRFFDYIDSHPEECFKIDYSNLKLGDERLRELFGFLGLTFDAAAIEQVLATPHSYDLKTFKTPENGA